MSAAQIGGWGADELEALLGGRWTTPPAEGWRAQDFAIMGNGKDIRDADCLFIAMDEKTWVLGSGNTGAYAEWDDTHKALKSLHRRCCGAIVQRPVAGLPAGFPQLVVKNSYAVMQKLADEARRRMTGRIIAITGTVGKSTTKDLLAMLLQHEGSVVSTKGNHNTRTGVSVTLARCITDPYFAVLEVAVSALWLRDGGVGPRIMPDICIITEIGLSQVGSEIETLRDTARFKARICNGIKPGGQAILNRDMAEFDFIATEARRFGANVVSYGFHDEADIRVLEHRAHPTSSDVRLLIDSQELAYRLDVPGKGMVSNSAAVLAAAKALGLDLATAAKRLLDFQSRGKLQSKPLPLSNGGQVDLIDDNYNAEVLSMKAAFEVTATQPLRPGGRRIAVLGRIINLGNQAPTLHASLAAPIVAAGFEKVFMHGEEMQHLQAALPTSLDGGVFQDATSIVKGVTDYLRDGDVVLVKGSVRASDFGSVPQLIEAGISAPRDTVQAGSAELSDDGPLHDAAPLGDRPSAEPKRIENDPSKAEKSPSQAPAEVDNPPSETLPADSSAGLLVDLSSGEVLASHNEDCLFSPRNLTHLMLIILCAERLARDRLNLAESVTIRPTSPQAVKDGLTTGLPVDSQSTVSDLIRALVVWNARDAAISLAVHLCGKTGSALKELNTLASRIWMRSTVLLDISGREQTGQQTTLNDVARFMQYAWKRHPNRLHWFSASEAAFEGETLRNWGNLLADGRANFAFTSTGGFRWGFAIGRSGGRAVLACAAGGHDAFNLDYQLDRLLAIAEAGGSAEERGRVRPTPARDITCKDDTVRIHVLGDTYFGEMYTARRTKKGVEDALVRHGYDHSFLGIRDLLAEGDFNIANFEAALADQTSDELAGRKPFLLTGNPGRSVAALRQAGIHAVALGNNHALDAGLPGLECTLAAFDDAGLSRFGAGRDANEAEAPLVLEAGGKTYKLFSAYWYRRYMEQDCSFYAVPRRGGVACLSGGILDAIRAEKRQAMPATVIVLAHWGNDFTWTSDGQRSLARNLVKAGADLVIGSGPHMLGEIERIADRWVMYSVGNGVFNSDGEYEKRGMPPYGFVARLLLRGDGLQVRLYPILTNNHQTFWQPRLLKPDEFQHMLSALNGRGCPIPKGPHHDGAWWSEDESGRRMIVLPDAAA